MLQVNQRLYNLTQAQAAALPGARIALIDDEGDTYETGTVETVTPHDDDSWIVRVPGDHIYLNQGDDYSIKILSLAPTAETLDQRIVRLRAELADAEAEKARDGAPEGWRWVGAELRGPDCSEIRPSGREGCVSVTDSDDDQAIVPFDALAAYVDHVRRNRGEGTPDVAAPVQGKPVASEVPVVRRPRVSRSVR